jgi:hypothetical protein
MHGVGKSDREPVLLLFTIRSGIDYARLAYNRK